MSESQEARIVALERRYTDLSDMLSFQAGELLAMQAAFYSFLTIAGDIEQIQGHIEGQLETTYSSILAATNQKYFDGFERAASTLRSAMNAKADQRKQQGG